MNSIPEICEEYINQEQHHAKILIVDDGRENHRVIERILAKTGAEFYNALSGQEAISLSLRHKFTVVLLDVMMPQMDGFETASVLRFNEETKDVPIIFITAADRNKEFEFKGYELGAVDYLSKPVKAHTLLSKVNVFIKLESQRYQLEQTLDDIKRLENRNQLILDSVGEGILGIEINGDISFINPAGESILKVTEHALINKHFFDVVYNAEDEDGLQTQWCNMPLLEYCKKGEKYTERTATFKRNNDEYFAVEYTATPIRDEQDLIGIVVAFQDITERKKAEQQLQQLARYDSLTGLLNRYAFGNYLKQLISRVKRQHSSFALLFIDMDKFKNVNDTLGHETGDSLLQEVAVRFKSLIRDCDVLCRLGGDEFTLAIEAASSRIAEDAIIVSEKLLKSFEQPFNINNHEISIGASIGISVYPESGTEISQLMQAADLAMYKAKETGTNLFQFFTEKMQEEALENIALEKKLRRAISHQEFSLMYQPKIDLQSNKVIGVEALIRWQKDGKNILGPDTFIPALEELGLIEAVGEFVLKAACQFSQRINQLSLDLPIKTAINLSLKEVINPQITQIFENQLEQYELPGEYFEIEITETSMMHEPKQTIKQLHAFHETGASIAIDDFGTGYSSLSHLSKLPLDVLKIDRSFCKEIGQNRNTENIIKSTIALAHTLELKVVAEGVETEEQLAFLKSMNCDIIQGYYYSPPLHFDELVEFVKKHQ
ncbi:EAL domain-containing protein [Thalassotalea fusca]